MDERRIVVGTDRHVDVAVVIEDLEFGGRAGFRSLGRHLLRVVARPLAFIPGRIIFRSSLICSP